MSDNTYASDVEFLRGHTKVLELLVPGGGRVAVAPDYQGRVMTCAMGGGEAGSFGWVNRSFIEAGIEDAHFNNYGGADRFWIGPEGGRFALWFKEGEPFDLDHWKTPLAFGTGSFQVTAQDTARIAMAVQFDVTNYSGTTFHCSVDRTISTLGRGRAGELLGGAISGNLAVVGFESANTLTNTGDAGWTRDTGLLSIWTLGQFNARPGCWVIIPFRVGDEAVLGVKATTDYFGELPPERYKLTDEHLLFCCDGQWRSKVGISAARAKPICGSYDPSAALLSIVHFNLPDNASQLPYVNSRWEMQGSTKADFAGDVVNAYSDGPGSGHETKTGPFYELETSSPAAELKPNQSLTHYHRTLHFAGEFNALNDLGQKLLGVDLREIRQ